MFAPHVAVCRREASVGIATPVFSEVSAGGVKDPAALSGAGMDVAALHQGYSANIYSAHYQVGEGAFFGGGGGSQSSDVLV